MNINKYINMLLKSKISIILSVSINPCFASKEIEKAQQYLIQKQIQKYGLKNKIFFPLMGLKTTIGFEHNGTTSIFSKIKKQLLKSDKGAMMKQHNCKYML